MPSGGFPTPHCRATRTGRSRRARGWLYVWLVCFSALPRLAGAQVFHDDFNGDSLDPAVWSVDLGDGGQISVANGVVTVTCTGSTFPVTTTVEDPFPPGEFLVRVR